MGLWDDDADQAPLRPSPAALSSAAARSSAARSSAADRSPAERRPRRVAAPGSGDRRDASPAGSPSPAPRRASFRGAGIAAVILGTSVLLVAGPVQKLRSPDPAPAAQTLPAARPQPALPKPAGPGTLARPVSVLLDPAAAPKACPKLPAIRCASPEAVVTADEARGVEVVDRGTAAAVVLRLTSWDAATLDRTTRPLQRVKVRLGAEAPVSAVVDRGGIVAIPVRDRVDAVSMVGRLKPVAAPKPRTGAGALRRPLELWTAAVTPGRCAFSAVPGARGVRVVDRTGRCLRLAGPALRLRSVADLRLLKPAGTRKDWIVSLDLVAADRPALAKLTRSLAPRKGRLAFVVGDRVLGGVSTVTAEVGGGVQLGVADEAEARLVVRRLRS